VHAVVPMVGEQASGAVELAGDHRARISSCWRSAWWRSGISRM
jgi:hypothetical protein